VFFCTITTPGIFFKTNRFNFANFHFGWDMKPEQIYQELKDLAEKLGIKVAEKSFRNIAAGIHFQSGLCKIREKDMYIMDRNLSLSQKNEILAECLAGMDYENIYMVPALREFLDKHRGVVKSSGSSA